MHEDAFRLLNVTTNVSRETFERLVLYHDLLLKWQAKVNLISNDTLPNVWTRHFLDSLQILPHIPKTATCLLDIGSGAGFPGLVLAIAGGREVHLVESDLKKIAFLREVARVTQTDIVLHPKRIENVLIDGVDVVTSRACSSLDSLLTYAGANVSHETICLFHKGKNFGTEVEDALRYWDFQYIVVPSVTDTQGVVLKITNILRRGYGTNKVEN